MHDLIEKIRSELQGAWRFRRYALFTAWGVCLLGWLVVLGLPDKYEARARVNVDTRTALTTVMQGQVIAQDFEAQLNLIRQALLGRSNLESVAQQVGINLTGMTPQQREAELSSLSERIEIALEPPAVRDPRIPNTLYRIVYTDHERAMSLKVVNVLLDSFVEGSMRTDRTGTATAQKFLREQLAEYGRRLAESEAALAAFKKNNMGLVPGDQGDYFQRLSQHIQIADGLQAQLRVAESRRNELTRQLRGEAPFVPSGETPIARGSSGQVPQDTASRIQETQARLDDLLLRFTDRHPDVIAARETLDQLKARQAAELVALKRGDAGVAAASGASTNPVHQNIQLQLNTVEVEIAGLRAQLADRRKAEQDLRRLVDTVPEVEAEYARLMRDYGSNKTQYDDLFSRQERARLSSDAEQTGTVKFNIVDPPSSPYAPIFPNRPLFLFLVLFLGLALGGGLAYLLHMIKPVFADSRTLAELTGLPVLGTVMRGWAEKQRLSLRHGLMRYVAMAALLFVVFVITVFIQQPASRALQHMLG